MHELTEEQRDDRLIAGDAAATTAMLPVEEEFGEEPDDELDEEAVIRERLRQIRLESAHIPVAQEPPPSLLSRIKALFRR